MKRTGLLYDERFLKHRTGANHPELPERLTAIYNGIRDRGLLEHLQVIPAQAAPRMWIETVHDRDYVDRFEAACRNGQESFESPDNQMCADTYDVALLAVGGILDIADRIDLSRNVRYVLVRKATYEVQDRMRLSNVCEELVAETFALRGALDQSGDVDELDDRRDDFLR